MTDRYQESLHHAWLSDPEAVQRECIIHRTRAMNSKVWKYWFRYSHLNTYPCFCLLINPSHSSETLVISTFRLISTYKLTRTQFYSSLRNYELLSTSFLIWNKNLFFEITNFPPGPDDLFLMYVARSLIWASSEHLLSWDSSNTPGRLVTKCCDMHLSLAIYKQLIFHYL